MGKVDKMAEEKVEAPERIWISSSVEFKSLISKGGPAFDNDLEYRLVDASNTRQRAERAAMTIADRVNTAGYIGEERRKEITDIITAEFEK